MAAGSEQPTWKWADDVRHCDTCGSHLRIKDVGLFHSQTPRERTIRCQSCVEAKRDVTRLQAASELA